MLQTKQPIASEYLLVTSRDDDGTVQGVTAMQPLWRGPQADAYRELGTSSVLIRGSSQPSSLDGFNWASIDQGQGHSTP
jgi:hypothetical protein